MKYTRLVAAALLLAAACQEKESLIPETQHVQLFFGDELSDTKADVDGLSGLTTWGTGDQIAIFIAGAGANAYQTKTVTGGMIPVSLTSGQSRTNYAIYPATAAVSGHHTASDLQVNYPASYDLSALSDDAKATYSPLPMVAANNTTGALVFYNVGAVLRLTVNSIPAATRYLRFTVPGKNIAGNYTVTGPGTATPTVALADGASSSVTFRLAAETIGALKDLTLNLPVPAGNYSAVDYVAIEALGTDGSTVLATTRANATRWTTLSRRKGRKQTSSFAPADFVITSAETTLWKGEIITYAANYPGAVWSVVSGEDKISVNETTGKITATAAGVASVKATLNGLVDTPAVNVYVNEVTGISVEAEKSTVLPSEGTTVTATLAHTDNGTIVDYPNVAWTSSSTSYVTVSPASSTPVYATATTATATTTATGVESGGSSTITASVPNYGTATANCSITCKLVADLTFPSGGEKYKFRGYYMHPGSFYWNGSSFSITDGTDPLEIVTHFATEGTPPSGSNRFYLSWTELYTLSPSQLSVSDGVITGTVHADDAATGNHDWRIPTLTSSTAGELAIILNNAPAHPIKINSTDAVGDNTRNYLYVNVKLPTTGTYANKGLGYYSSNSGSSAGDKAYQAGMLLVPDGAHLTCPGMNSSSGHGSSDSKIATNFHNVIDYDDLLILVDKGCVFLPDAGMYNGAWYRGGGFGYYWSASQQNDLIAYCLYFSYDYSFSASDYNKSSYYFPVRVVR